MGVRRLVAWFALVVVIAGLTAATPAAAQVLPLPVGGYQINATYKAPNGALVDTTQDAILLVPALVDVDHNASSGAAGMDVLVELTAGAGSLTLRTVKLLPEPAPVLLPPVPMPLRLEVVVADPRPGSSLRVALGFDALADTAPSIFEATFGILGAGRGQSFSVDLATSSAGSTLGLTAALFEPAPGGRLNPKQGRIDYTPVPGSAHVGVATGSAVPGSDQVGLELTTDTPTRAGITLSDVQGTAVTSAEGVLDRLPSSLSLLLTRGADGTQAASYRATDRVAAIGLRLARSTGGVLQEEIVLDVADMAREVDFVQDTPSHGTIRADSPVGSIEVALATGGPVRRLADPNAYLYQDDRGGVQSIAARVLGLHSAEFSAADPFLIQVTAASGPLHVVRNAGTSFLEAWIRDLPSTVRLSFSASAGTLSYAGSAPIGEVTLDATNPAGITGRATRLHLLARDVPTELELAFAQGAGSVSLDAKGQTLGLIEVLLTSGPVRSLDPSVDGVLVEDLADRYVVFARVTGLRKIVATQGPPPDILLETAGGRVFVLDLNQLKGAKVEYVRATLDRLVPSMRVQFVEGARSQEVVYTASAPTNGLTLDTNSGNRWNLHAFVGSPLPASMRFCASSNGYCTGFARSAGAGAFAFSASEHTTIDVFDCVRPLAPTCTSAPTEYTRVNLRIRHLEADADFQSLGFSGYTFINTTNAGGRHGMNGSLATESASGGGFRASFPPGFSADRRKVDWTFFGLVKTKTGSITCPPGTSLEVRVLGFWLGVTSFMC